jgi:hypothetical protein
MINQKVKIKSDDNKIKKEVAGLTDCTYPKDSYSQFCAVYHKTGRRKIFPASSCSISYVAT